MTFVPVWKYYKFKKHYIVYTPFTRNCLVLVDGEKLSKVKIQSDVKETKQKQHTCANKDFKEGLQSNRPFAAWGPCDLSFTKIMGNNHKNTRLRVEKA